MLSYFLCFILLQEYTELSEGQILKQSLKEAADHERENPDWFMQTHKKKIVRANSRPTETNGLTQRENSLPEDVSSR